MCGYEDPLSGARCTLDVGHTPPHRDKSSWEFEFQFRDVQHLIVPSSGTDDENGLDDIVII